MNNYITKNVLPAGVMGDVDLDTCWIGSKLKKDDIVPELPGYEKPVIPRVC